MITTLLIVDDSEIDRRKYCCYLNSERPHTYLILETDNLEKAKEICAEKRTDAILLGLSLTDDSSLDFLNWMKQQGQIALLPTLLLTKQIDEYTAAQASKNGIQDYLIKEYLTSQRLVQSLDHLFERIRLINTISDALSLRKRAEELIAEGCEKFYNFLECSNDLIWSINLEGNFIYLSPQFQELFGWEPADWIGKSMIDLIHLGDRLRFKKSIERVLDPSKKRDFPIKFRHYKSDGSCIWVSSNVNPARNSLGDVIGIQGVLRDISDRVALAYAIRDRKLAKVRLHEFNKTLSNVHQELAQSQWAKDEFLATMSYELRTSLSVILGLVENLQEEVYGSLNQKQIKALQTIEHGENHLLKLINDILDFSKADVGFL